MEQQLYVPESQYHQEHRHHVRPQEPSHHNHGQQFDHSYIQQMHADYPHQEYPAPQPVVPPIVSVSASTPMAGETLQPQHYFALGHRASPAVVPPPTGLNLSSYSFLLMEKRDREREAMERANRGYLMGEASTARNQSASSSPGTQHVARVPSPRIEPPQHTGYTGQAADERPLHPQYLSSDKYAGVYSGDGSHYPSQAYDGPYPQQQQPPYHGYAPAYPPPAQQGYSQHPFQYQYQYQQNLPAHHYHSSSSNNTGQDTHHSRQQDYVSDHHGSASYQSHTTMLPPHQHLHHSRAMSPNLLDKPRFANTNLSVFRQSAAEDSDGNASVSSSGSLKRRRRPTKVNDGKRSLLPGSALGSGSHGGLGHYLMSRTSSHGSAEGQEFYDDDDDSLDEHFDVRNGLQGLNLQKTAKSSVLDRSKKLRTKAERPFKIGELVESMKSDTDGTWFAGRVLDLEDDPHNHINPKSVLIHFEGFSPHHDEWVKPSQLRACSTGSSFLRYGPNGHEPAENWIAYEKFYHSDLGRTARRHTGLAYDRRMLLHKCQCNTNPEERHHPEQPERLVEILCQFQKHGMLSLVKWVQGREATIEELIAAHTDTHVRNYCCTAAQNKRYALENGITDPDLQTEDDLEEEQNEEVEEAPGENGGDNETVPAKAPVRRGRPRKNHRGSIFVPTTATSPLEINPAMASEFPDALIESGGVDGMEKAQSPTEISKDPMEVDLHSPMLGRRRSSMRGSAIRMSSLVSMSSTLFAQREEDMVPEEAKEATLVVDDEEDDDDKPVQPGPAPSEAALAVAGGMDPTLASQLSNSPRMAPKTEQEDKSIPQLSIGRSESELAGQEMVTAHEVESTISGDVTREKPRGFPGGSRAPFMEGERRSSRSTHGQSGAIIASQDKTREEEIEVPEMKEVESKDKKATATVTDRSDQAQKDAIAAKALTKKKSHQAVSPAPGLASDSTIIRPPGLTFTMSCGQLGIAVDTTWNPFHSSTAARVAAGSLINLVDQVVTGRCKNGFAIIRPPGHHAEEDEAMGFCFFNNVGVAVNLTLSRYPLTVQKILIIDWDVHHGNGTQQIFYENPNVLYISLHRWDNGHFYPFTGAPDECGEEAGEGTNVNIAWSSYGRGQAMGDVEYIAAFWYVLLPIARQFQPDLVMVSAGFDAADGHAANIGGYTVSPQGFAMLTRLVQTLAGGRVILSLEGGYEFEPLAMSATACLEELLPHSLLPATATTRAFPFASFQGTLNSVKPNAMAVSSLHQVLKYQQKYWKFPPEVLNPSFRFQLPAEWKASNSLATRPRRERNTRRKAPVLDT
ncbi:Histone deacetylase 4 [Mortierella claussenii]|nr:Histone deacetylase 4 [Mortierella claussenii]